MSTSCSIQLKADQLPKVFSKVEFFLFRVLEKEGIDPYDVIKNPKTEKTIAFIKDIKSGKITKEELDGLVGVKYSQGLINASKVKNLNQLGIDSYRVAQMALLFNTIKNVTIPEYVSDYINKAKILRERGAQDDIEGADLYLDYAKNLQNLVVLWDQVATNFLSSSDIFNTRIKFKMNEDGLVDLNDMADSDKKMVSKMVYDKPSNEIDPFDDIDLRLELFLRSIPEKDVPDSYGFTSSVNYPNLIKNLYNDLSNSVGYSELMEKLEINKSKIPQYQYIIDKLKYNSNANRSEIKLRLSFVKSLSKAYMQIMLTSAERSRSGGIAFKVTEATSNKSNTYTGIIESNFTSRGMPVNDGKQTINLAHQVNGVWELTKEDIPKIKAFLKEGNFESNKKTLTELEFKKRAVEFLKALGFDFSPITEEKLIKSDYLFTRKGEYTRFEYIYNNLIKSLDPNNPNARLKPILNPIKVIKNDVKNLVESEKGLKRWEGQNNTIVDLINAELKNNTTYNIENSILTPEGTRQHSIQLHNNFTILTNILSKTEIYDVASGKMKPVTLQTILENEPSMFWLDPVKNPSIRSDYYLNSLFYFDPADKNFGKRRKVKDKNYSFNEDAEPVKLSIINTGHLQVKLIDDFITEGASSTDLNELDKILHDMHTFYAKAKGYAGVLRLSDKSTDLGINLNYGLDVATGRPIQYGKPLGNIELKNITSNEIFATTVFRDNVKNALLDYLELRYLGEKGFFKSQNGDSGLSMADANFKNWSYFEDIISSDLKKDIIADLDSLVESPEGSIDMIKEQLKKYNERLNADILTYFSKRSESFYNKINDVKVKFGTAVSNYSLTGLGQDLKVTVDYFIANSFITDLSQMKLFFGDAMFFKDFHKRASKDSATGVFTIMDDYLINDLNNRTNPRGYGVNTNLSARRFIERIYQEKLNELEKTDRSEEEKEKLRIQYKNERDEALLRQTVSKSFKSAVLKDIIFDSEEVDNIVKNIEYLINHPNNYLSDQMKALYKADLRQVIQDKYKDGNEADGQGKCTFDFYRIMCIATDSWDDNQEEVYKKIIQYNHYDELAESTTDEAKRVFYIKSRDAVGYDPTENVYFPPKKFQYSGPEGYSRIIDGQEFVIGPPIFDKFSLQPLIPTVLKQGSVKTADWYLNRKMEYNGVGYVKFESGTKVESPSNKDEYYTTYDPTNPSVREIAKFNPESKFKSEQELFFAHFKEQMAIDAEIHEASVFGSQIRKLILMNLSDRPEFEVMKDNYETYLGQLVEIEKVSLYNEMGIQRTFEIVDGKKNVKLKITDLSKVVEYFINQVSKKNQDINVRKALKYDEVTGKFEIPLDASVQAQILEGIIVSAINGRVVNYKTNGSMLTQISVTGSQKVKFNKQDSIKALETYGNSELKFYDIVEGKDGNPTTSKMDVKIALTGQWLRLLDLKHPDGSEIATLERLNALLMNDAWRADHEKHLTMIAYRIPTQGRNFLDVMQIKQFLPAAVGDAIIMPKECVIKSGSDFDIDKMFVFYPNLSQYGEYMEGTYTNDDLQNPDKYQQLKGIIQNRLYQTMGDIILHPANYPELVTPSFNFHILPLLDKIFEKLGIKKEGQKRKKTDYSNTKILEREKNYQKFLSLLKGKSDLGIAAVANTFNVLFQLSKARANSNFLKKEKIKTFFNSTYVDTLENDVIGIDYSSIYDEDGMLKSEFFSEFINAFVDVAKDDYVFAANIVTELSPIMFYMKYAGISSGKILNFMNQPALREYIRNLSIYQNKFIKLNGIGVQNYDSPRKRALEDTLSALGYKGSSKKEAIEKYIVKRKFELNITTDLTENFTEKALLNSITTTEDGISKLTEEQKLVQISMLLELENLKVQSNSLTDTQRYLNFDTSPYTSTFDAFIRNSLYIRDTITNSDTSILNAESIKNIKKNSIISPLDVSQDIATLLNQLFPVRNDFLLNNFLSLKVFEIKNDRRNSSIVSQDDMLKFARTAKNDFSNYVLQNYIDNSEEGMKFFHETFDTNKGFNEYLAELVETNKLIDMWNDIKDMTDKDADGNEYKVFQLMTEDDQFPFTKNILVSRGENNSRILTFKIIKGSSNVIEKNSIIYQFNELTNLTNPDFKLVKDFFKNLALYSVFQSGMNTSEVSYTELVPVDIVNKLYGYALNEREKQLSETTTNAEEKLNKKRTELNEFYKLFKDNNPLYVLNEYGDPKSSTSTPTKEKNSRGKWYAKDLKLDFRLIATPAPTPVMTPVNKEATVILYEGTAATKQAARDRKGVYTMRPNQGDKIPGVDEIHHFGNPWSHKGYQGTIKTGSLSEAEAKALGTWKGDVTSTAISEAADNYEKWLKGEAFQEVEPERRKWILDVINAGRLDGKNLLYFKSGYRSHADILADFINTRPKEVAVAPVSVERTVSYTPKGQEKSQIYTIKGSKIYNKTGKEVFDKPGVDRNKILANLAVKEGRAVTVEWKEKKYVVNNKDQIISVTTGDIMKWGEENGDRKGILALAKDKFAKAKPEVVAAPKVETPTEVTNPQYEGKPEFNKLPAKSETPTMTYAGIGSRETPKEVLETMTKAATYLESLGYTLNTGKTFLARPSTDPKYQKQYEERLAFSKKHNGKVGLDEEGADRAFSLGATRKNLFGVDEPIGQREMAVMEEIHPKPDALKTGAKKLMARNTNQVFGKNLDTPVDFVLFYAKEVPGSIRPEGGTGQAVEMARRKGIPTINMADSNWREQLKKIVQKPIEKQTPTVTTPSIFDARKVQIDYTAGQTKALAEIGDLIKAKKQGYYLLAGYAGTGKTTIAENIAKFAKQNGKTPVVLAPTNKAAKVLNDKLKSTGVDTKATTIHKAIYGEPDPITGEWVPGDKIKNSVLIIDESSMISKEIMKDLIDNTQNNNILIFMGDSFQLEPVGEDSGLFKGKVAEVGDNKTELTEVKRQSLDSNVLKVATITREDGKPYVPSTSIEDFKVSKSRNEFIEDFKSAIRNNEDAVAIVATNAERILMNKIARQEKFGSDKNVLNEEDVMISVANSSKYPNSEIFEMGRIDSSKEMDIEIETKDDKKSKYKAYFVNGFTKDGKSLTMLHVPLLDKPSLYHAQLLDFARKNSHFMDVLDGANLLIRTKRGLKLSPALVIATYGYSVTAHKSQGSQWEKVFVNQNYIAPSSNGARWYYTAITRSSKDVIVLNTGNNIGISEEEMNKKLTILEAKPIEKQTPIQILKGKLDGSKLSQEIEGKLEANKDRLIDLLGSSMYSEKLKDVVYKELLQNAFDATKIAESKGLIDKGKIDIEIDEKDRVISFTDNGIGMTPEIVQKAFFTIGGTYKGEDVDNKLKSGGLGLAKMAFIFGSEKLNLETIHNGIKTTVDATSEEIRKDNFKIRTEATNQKNGTKVSVKIPKTYIDSKGETRQIDFPTYLDVEFQYSFLANPLIGNVDVNYSIVNRESFYKKEERLKTNLGNIPEGYVLFSPAKTNFADMNIYIDTKNITKGSTFDTNHKILSSGLYQFNVDFQTIDREKIPLNIIIDIKPKVDATNAQYPFNNQRENFRPTVNNDISALNKYLALLWKSIEIELLKSSFNKIKNIDAVDVENVDNSVITKNKEITKSFTAASNSDIIKTAIEDFNKKNEEAIINNGDLKTKQISLKKEDIDKDVEKAYSRTFKAEKEISLNKETGLNLDSNKPIIHNNTDMTLDEKSTKFLSEISSIMIEYKKSIIDFYGENYSSNIKNQLWGVSIDKTYGGVNVNPSFLNMLAINPFYNFPDNPKVDAVNYIAVAIDHLIIHELNHNFVRNEGPNFTGRFMQTYSEIHSLPNHFELVSKLKLSIKNNLETIKKLNYEYQQSKNVESGFEGNKLEKNNKRGTNIRDTTVSKNDTTRNEITKRNDVRSYETLGEIINSSTILLPPKQLIDAEVPWYITTPTSEITERYNKEKLSGETIEEFLKRLSCKGLLK